MDVFFVFFMVCCSVVVLVIGLYSGFVRDLFGLRFRRYGCCSSETRPRIGSRLRYGGDALKGSYIYRIEY